jgi:hypothetical protein
MMRGRFSGNPPRRTILSSNISSEKEQLSRGQMVFPSEFGKDNIPVVGLFLLSFYHRSNLNFQHPEAFSHPYY